MPAGGDWSGILPGSCAQLPPSPDGARTAFQRLPYAAHAAIWLVSAFRQQLGAPAHAQRPAGPLDGRPDGLPAACSGTQSTWPSCRASSRPQQARVACRRTAAPTRYRRS